MSLMAVSLFQVVLKEYHSEPSRAAAETGGKCSTPQPSILGLSSPRVQRGTSPGLCWECCSNSPGNLPYPKVSSSRQPLQEEPSHAGTGSRTPLTHCILSSHAVIFTRFKFCLLQSHTVPTTTQCPFPFLF